jgi:hypothetical protein
MVAATPVTPYPSASSITRRADESVSRVLPVVQRLARASVRNLAPAALYFAVAPTCMWLADLTGMSATWPRHWMLAATAAASTVLARRLRARPATIACGAVTAVLVSRELVHLVLPTADVSAMSLLIAAGIGMAIGEWQTPRAQERAVRREGRTPEV